MVEQRKLGRKCGVPKPKTKFVRESGIYCVGQATTVETRKRERGNRTDHLARGVVLPKIRAVRLRGGVVPPTYKLISARVLRDGDRWMFAAQIAVPRPEPLAALGRGAGDRPRGVGPDDGL